VDDFFAPRCRNKSKQLNEDEEGSSKDNELQETECHSAVPKTENVRRSSRLSAQAAAAAIAQALQVTAK